MSGSPRARAISRYCRARLESISVEGLMLLLTLAYGVDIRLGLAPLGLLRLLCVATLVAMSGLSVESSGGRRAIARRPRLLRRAILSLLFAAVASTIAIGLFAPPAAAQFFQSAEDWMSQQFPDAADVVPVVFNVLRGLFVLYVGIALVKVINAMRDDEDWKSLARTPLIILIAVTLGDVLVVLIIGQ